MSKVDLNFVIRPKLNVLSKKEIESLYFGALEVLEQVGVRVLHPQALSLLKEAGCSVSQDSMVRIRPSLVEHALQTAPKRLSIFDREGEETLELGGDNTGGMNTYYGTGSDLKYTYDPYTGELRLTVAKDIANMAKVVDFLPNLDFVMSYGLPSDCQLDHVYRTEFLEMVQNSTKPIVFTSDNGDNSRKIIETEFWFPFLSNRERLENWKEQGGKTMKEKLDEQVRNILANHIPKPLRPKVIKELGKS